MFNRLKHEDMDIILRPLIKNSWPGIIKYKNCYEDISPYFTRSGRIYTGLTKQDADRLGELLGEDLSPGSEFWKNFFIRTFGKDLYLRVEDPTDELKYLFLKNHKRVKASLMENKATANFVLINKEEEAKRSNLSNEAKLEAMTAFTKMTPEEMRKCLRLFGKNASNMSDTLVKNRLFDIVEGDPISFLRRWVNNEERDTEFLIESAIAANIIRRNKNIFKYGSDVIGHTLNETIDFLNDPKNQDIKIAIAKQIEGKQFIEPESFTDAPTFDEDKKSEDITHESKEFPDGLEDEVVVKKPKSRSKKYKEDTI